MGWIVLAVIAALIFFAISIYNRLVAGRNRFKNAFAQIDVQLTRRHDLIPNLVETAKGYLKHERETLEAVINARNAAVSGLKAAAADPSDPALTALAATLDDPNPVKVSFGTEAGFFRTMAGIPSVVVGPGSIAQAHKPDEYLAVDQLAECLKMLDFRHEPLHDAAA